jgi:rhamnosyltransferase
MRIIQVVHGFPPDAWAGTELVTFYLARTLQARGHHVTVLTRTEDPGAEEFSLCEECVNGVEVVRVVNNHSQTSGFRLFYDNPFYDELFSRFLAQARPDVVHFQHLAHFSVRLLPRVSALGYPTLLSLHDFFFPCHRIHLIDAQERLCPGPERGERCVSCLEGLAPPDEIRRRFTTMEEVLQAPDVILTASRFLREKIQGYFPLAADRLRLVPLGIPPFPRQARKPRTNGRLRLLYVGLLFPPKGAHVLIEALKGLPPEAIEASLYGATLPFWQPYVDRLQQEAKTLAVHFHGAYTHDQLSTILSEHDVLVMPMICEETFSLLAREALMAGLPVVAARRGALSEVIHDDVNGLLFEPENAADLRRCLARLINDPRLVEQLRPSEPRYKTTDEYAQELERIYDEVIAYAPQIRSRRIADARDRALALREESEKQFTGQEERLSTVRGNYAASYSCLIGLSSPSTGEDKGGGEQPRIRTVTPHPDLPPQGGKEPKSDLTQEPHAASLNTVSVLLPTKNGERYLVEVIESIRRQCGDFTLSEIIAVDSGSRDQTLRILHRLGVTVLQIPPHEFGHGKTRNLLASHATGEFLAFLTQDATPADEHWLETLLAPLRTDPLIAGAYSRHLPRPNCHPMEWRRIVEYDCPPHSHISCAVGNPDYARNPDRYQSFANTSSVIRRSVWRRIPFPEIEFAEDKAWAMRVLEAGYKTAYAADSVVVHSHSYGFWVNFCRHFEHFWALRTLFARPRSFAFRNCLSVAMRVARADLAFWRHQSGQSKVRVTVRWAVPAVCWHLAANLGIWLGEHSDALPPRFARLLSLQERLKRR